MGKGGLYLMKPNILPLKSVRNPRDLGGYIGFNGRKLKFHRLLRTGKISNLSSADEQFLKKYGLKKIIDLRSPDECKLCPDVAIDGIKHYSMPLSDIDNTAGGQKDLKKAFEEYRHDQYAGFKMMCTRYHDHVYHKHAQQILSNIFQILLETKDGAVLFHCSEGKDRTGIVAMIVMYALGVDLETIRQDYLWSNYILNDYRYRRDCKFKEEGENDNFRANMRILGSVMDPFFDTALITIQKEFGGLDAYLENQLGIDSEKRDQLRELYLEKK